MTHDGHSVVFIGTQSIPFKKGRIEQYILRVPFTEQENIVFWFFFILLSFAKALTVTGRHQIHRIVTFGPFYTLLCGVPICLLKIPAVTIIRADNMKHSRNPVRKLFFYVMDGIGIRLSDRVIFPSVTLKKIYLKRYRVSEKKVCVISNNITEQFRIEPEVRDHLRRSLKISPRTFVVSTAGVFNRGKNFEFLIDSMVDLVSQDVKLLIIGDEVVPNGERKRLKKITADGRLTGHVIFAGWQNDPRPLIASSELFVFPSKYEGSPNALLEALGCGVPCLGSMIDEIEEILAHRELLFTLKTNHELTQKIAKAVIDGTFYGHIKALSEDRCRHFLFDWEKQMLTLSLT
jgi:glycosyltransferase involved in cell wall biosynthesis